MSNHHLDYVLHHKQANRMTLTLGTLASTIDGDDTSDNDGDDDGDNDDQRLVSYQLFGKT